MIGGNARINFRANGTAVTFLQELHYYPFGMIMEGIGTAPVTNNGYKYNGKELNEDLGLNLSDYGARWYDANLGRWWSVDVLAENSANNTPYSYCLGNPLAMIDPDGRNTIVADQNGYIIYSAEDNLDNAVTIISNEDKTAFSKKF